MIFLKSDGSLQEYPEVNASFRKWISLFTTLTWDMNDKQARRTGTDCKIYINPYFSVMMRLMEKYKYTLPLPIFNKQKTIQHPGLPGCEMT